MMFAASLVCLLQAAPAPAVAAAVAQRSQVGGSQLIVHEDGARDGLGHTGFQLHKRRQVVATGGASIEEGEAIIKIELEKGNAYRITRKAEQELYARKKEAQGNLLVKKAEAYKTKLKNRALKGLGSENLVGLEMAKVLEGVDVIVLPSDGEHGFNPLNLEKIQMLLRKNLFLNQ